MSKTSRTIQKFQADGEAWKAHHTERDKHKAQQECDTARMISHSRDLLKRTEKERKASVETQTGQERGEPDDRAVDGRPARRN